MEAGEVLFLIISFLIQTAHGVDFYGHSVTVLPFQRKSDGTMQLGLVSRENGRASCSNQVSYLCDGGACGNFTKGVALETTNDTTGKQRWCQTEQESTTQLTANAKNVSLSASGCCWASNVNTAQRWRAAAHMDLGQRSDTFAINHCPVTATVSSIRVPQNCFTTVRLLAHDPDGDEVKCRLTNISTANIVLDENKCSLSSSGNLSVGVHVFEVIMEDYPLRNITMSYVDGTVMQLNVSDPNMDPMCSVKMLFSLEVLSPLPSCELGHVQPMFLSKTPSQETLIYTSVGQMLSIYAEAQAHHNSIKDFQISGPRNMTKVFKDNSLGRAEVTLSWTPQQTDLYRHVPVCFTAETDETQSEMRCVVIVVTKSTITQGKADVICQSNKMTVSLEKASMPGIDVNYLMLLDKSCSLTSNSSHIMGTITFSTCGTKIEDKGDFIVFANEIDSFELPSEVITRRKMVKIGFSCQFPKFLSISTYFNLHQDDYIFTESTFGSFGYTFEIYKDKNFTQKVQPDEYPVQVKLFDMIYMSIQAKSDLQKVTMFVESCKATPDDNPGNNLYYDIIKDGCQKDETLSVKTSTDTTFNFEVQAFKFTGNNDQVYITCSVILCEKDSSYSRCSQGCVENANQARRRRRRGVAKQTVDHQITQGPLHFMGEAFPANDYDREEDLGFIAKQNLNTTPPVVNYHQERKTLRTQASGPRPRPTGSVRVRGAEKEDDDGDDDEDEYPNLRALLSSNLVTVIFASAFFISVIVMVILVCYLTKKSRAEDMKLLLDSE
ncbi:uncharacterized protein LOC117393785 [Periophthalmus magnuspinnatus]|uniref:uncharacterized protein LOC117393785 n=1 Tax=Periophthalmus magnuspinnatus TaxID=409849 RepID=UPI002436F919|nr:uncharacterized protein LOC117393785 [Periophthalmus magnuspinnatus]